MKNFVYLECENIESISKKIEIFLIKNNLTVFGWNKVPIDNLYEEVPELKNFIDSIGVTAYQIFALSKIVDDQIHIDYTNDIRINFPVSNTSGSATTFFYELENLKITKKINFDNLPWYDLSYTNKKIIDSYVLTKPVVFNPKIPHGVTMHQTGYKPRIILSIFLTTSPEHLLAI